MIRFIYGAPELYSPKTNGFYFPLEPAHIWTTVGHLGIIKTDCWPHNGQFCRASSGRRIRRIPRHGPRRGTQAVSKFEIYLESLNVAELGTNVATIEITI